MEFTSRLATLEDVPRLTAVMDDAIAELQRAFLDDEQIEASRAVMGIDTQLIEDGTYFVVETPAGDVAGCGGWSCRGTMYGNDHSPGRDTKLLDPAVDAARVRAMYTNPVYARRGVGRLVLSLCEGAAAAEGFSRLELVATLSGEPLYSAYGFTALERIEVSTGAVAGARRPDGEAGRRAPVRNWDRRSRPSPVDRIAPLLHGERRALSRVVLLVRASSDPTNAVLVSPE